MKNKIGDLIIQIISVMIGVFLGFIITHWSENNAQQKKAELLIKNISSEIQVNKKSIDQVINYHRQLLDSTRYYLKKDSIPYKPNFYQGVNTITFTSNAFETGIQTGLINEIPINKLQALNNVYTRQREYEEFSKLLMTVLLNLDFANNEEAKRKILMFLSLSMTDVVIKEEQLLESYQEALKLNLSKIILE